MEYHKNCLTSFSNFVAVCLYCLKKTFDLQSKFTKQNINLQQILLFMLNLSLKIWSKPLRLISRTLTIYSTIIAWFLERNAVKPKIDLPIFIC